MVAEGFTAAVAAAGTVNRPIRLSGLENGWRLPAVLLFGGVGYAQTPWSAGCGKCFVNQKEYGVAPFNW